MIPTFPEFKKISIDDRADIEAYTYRFPPYSDFNFTSLWAWDTNGERMISDLHGNLVVRFTDYSTHEPFLSFLGSNEMERTVQLLMDYCRENRLPQTLKLVPEISISGMQLSSTMTIEEDRDNFDYIYSIPELSRFAGGKFKGRRNFANRFAHDHPNAHVEIIDLTSKSYAREDILPVIDSWEQHKQEQNKSYEVIHERTAIERLFETADSHNLIVSGIFQGDEMLAFSIDEIVPNQFSISHFCKADIQYVGIYDALLQKKARHFESLGLAFFNFEQDLGIEGLRKSKMDYRPVDFLKKYNVSLK